jgi:hypothetical protein
MNFFCHAAKKHAATIQNRLNIADEQLRHTTLRSFAELPCAAPPQHLVQLRHNPRKNINRITRSLNLPPTSA